MKIPVNRFAWVCAVFCLAVLACGLPIPSSREAELQSTIDVLRTQGSASSGTAAPEQPAQTAAPAATLPPAAKTPGADVETTPQADAGQPFTLLGQIGGSSYAVAVEGNTAFIGQGPRLVALDVSNPANPRWIGQSEVLPGVVQGIQLAGKYAYVAARYGGLHIFDISDPAHPSLVSSLQPKPAGCNAVALRENLAYLACNPSGLFIVDISDPQKPVEISSGTVHGAVLSIAVVGNYAYLVDATSQGLDTVDISNPASPLAAGIYKPEDDSISYGYYSVRTCGNNLCLASTQQGLVVLGLSDPAKPSFTGKFGPVVASTLAVDGDLVYLVDDMDGVHILDVSKPAQPVQVGILPNAVGGFEFSVQESAERGIFLHGKTLYITDTAYGLTVADVSQAGAPRRIGHYQTPVPDVLQEVKISGNHAYLAGRNSGFRVVDVSDPANMREVSYDDRRKNLYTQSPTGMEIIGRYAYISDANYPFHIYDISDPAKPVQVGAVFDEHASDGAFDLAILGNTAYLSGWGGSGAFYPGAGMWVIDISNPAKPRAVRFVDVPNERWRMALHQSSLYLLDRGVDSKQKEPLSLRAFQLSNPFQPVEVSTTAIPELPPMAPSEILAADNLVYASIFPQTLKIFDVSDPAHPTVLPSPPAAFLGGSAHMRLKDRYLFTGGMMVYDAADPRNPKMAGIIPGVVEAWTCDAAGDLVYVATRFHGLYVFRFTPGTLRGE